MLLSPNNCEKHSHKIKTVKDAITLPSKTLGELCKNYGKEWIIGYISLWLIDLNDNANVKIKMNDAQIEFTSKRIYETYSLKITDLTLFFRNVKEGKYGLYYENLAQEKIMQWMAMYFNERCEYAQMDSQSNHEKFSMIKDKIAPEVANKMNEIVKNLDEVEHNHEKSGAGKRLKQSVVKNRMQFLNGMALEIKKMSEDQLKEHLLSCDIKSKEFDQDLYEMVERELDRRKDKTN